MGRDNDIITTRARQELGWQRNVDYQESIEQIGEVHS
jgi:hypothetical protein